MRWEKRSCPGKPASGGSEGASAPIVHHRSSFINPRGFTLIELLVVIAVLALLVAVLMPSLQRVRKHAKSVACQSNLRQWSLLVEMYLADHDRQFWPEEPRYQWIWKFERYRTDYPRFALCPMATKHEPNDPAFSTWQVIYGPPISQTVRLSYGVNEWLSSPPHSLQADYYWITSEVAGAARIPVILDCPWVEVHPFDWASPPQSPFEVYNGGSMCIDRHSGGVNMLLMDSSVRKVGIKELWTFKWSRKFNTAGKWTKAGDVQSEDWPEWMRSFKEY